MAAWFLLEISALSVGMEVSTELTLWARIDGLGDALDPHLRGTE